jgi:dTDP-4-amino-4,6-dideoxygalactose transaminase
MAPEAPPAVERVLLSGQVAEGPVVKAFERDLGSFFATPALAVNSCTSAISLALRLLDIGPGDEVITTAQTCAATNSPIVTAGATPVFVDIEPKSGLIDPDDVRRNLSPRTMAIVAVDWAGHACDYEALRTFGLPIIEDAAHAVGSRIGARHVAEAGGDIVCFSFQAIKHLTTGDGGALVTQDEELRTRARLLRWYGLDRESNVKLRFAQDITAAGYKFHMNDIAAAIGRANLKHLPDILRRHRANAGLLHECLKGVPHIELPPFDVGSSWWLFTIRVERPAVFTQLMAKREIACSPVHARNDQITAFRDVCRPSKRLGGLNEFASRQVSIPVGWWLDPVDVEAVAEAASECAKPQKA